MSRTRSSLAAVALLAVLMLLSVAMPAVAQEGRDLSIFNVEGGAVVSPDINIAAQRGNGKVSVIVKLATPPSYRNYVTAGGHKNKGVATAAADAQAAQIRAEQASFTTAATALGGRVTGSYQFLLNAVVVEIDADRVLSLAKVPGVVAIGPNRTYERAHTTSLPLIRASEVWEGALTGGSFTGEGVVVAVIDEGIDYSHAHFGGEQNYADNDPLVIGETGMEYFPPTVLPDTSAGEMKVIGGIDFVGDVYDAAGTTVEQLTPAPDPDPMGCDYSHGTHVAGSVAGYGVTTSGDTFVGDYTDGNALFPSYPNASVGSWRIGPGVAPEAYLVSLRVFGCNGSTGTDVLLASFEEAATETYLGLSVNVVNMSLGSAYGGTGPDDFLNVAQEALADMGIVVVASAGNSGDFQLVNGAPSSAKTTISVANITDSAAIVDGQLTYVDPVSTNTVNIAAAKAVAMYTTDMPDPLTAVIAIADVANGCSPLANDYTGKWVIVDRGVCGFSVKVESVKNANGLGAIIANNAPGAPFSAGQTAGFDDQLPTMMISQADGVALKAAVNAGLGDVSGTFDGGVGYALTEVALVPNTSTSRGGVLRGSNDTILKPNISGPGTSITSAGAGTNNLGYTISGTSMSAPHIAGAAALLIEALGAPEDGEEVAHIKQRLMNTATVDVRASEVATVPYQSPQRVGAGFADLVAAVNTELVAYSTESPENVSVSFGYPHALVNTTPSITKTITVENWSASAMTLATAYSPRSDWGGAAFSVSPAFVSVPANSTATVNVTLSLFPSQADLNVGGDPLFVITGKSILHEESGYVTLTPTSGNQTAIRVPVYAAPHITSDLSVAEEAIINGDTGSGELVISGEGYSFGPDFNDHLSLVSAFTLLAEDGEETGLFWDADGVDGEEADEELVDYGYADVNYVGANLTSGANTFLDVAVVMHDAWTSPRDLFVEVYLDLNNDGTSDYVWYYGSGASDVFNTSFVYLPDGRAFSFNTPLNFGHGASLDSMLFKNNVMVVPTIVSSGSFTSLGFPNWDGVSPIGVEVVTYQRDSDFTFEIDVVEGEYTKDIAFIAPGRALYAGLDGNVIPFTYDVTGLDTLPQILTIHHQNHDMESRSQVTSLAQITGTSFNLVSPANGAIVRDPADVTAATWTELEGATLYTFTLTKLSVNTGVRTSGDQTIVTATAADDGDLLTCATGTCTLDLTVVSLEDGVYSWVVVAGEAPNLIEASNNAYGFVVESDDLSLLLNGSFEDQGAKANKAANWAGKGVRKLGTTTVPALDGTYVLSVPVKGTAKQTLTMVNQPALAFLTTGQVLDFDLSTSRGKGKLAIITLKYTDGTSEKCTLGGVTNTAPLTDWEAKTLTCPVNKPVSSIIVVLRHSGGTQTQPTQYDAVSLVAPGAGGPRGSQLPLPTAPDGFRGNN
jgi:hypothetical protein